MHGLDKSAARLGAEVLAAALAARIVSLAELLLPAGKRVQRRTWRVGSLAGEPGQSLCIWLAGSRQGHWRDFASGEHGDALDLVAQLCTDGEIAAAMRWAADWLGLGTVDPAAIAARTARAEVQRQAEQRQAERDRDARRRRAMALWLAAAPLVAGDPVCRYLAESRGVEIAPLLPRLKALRCHPRLWHGESGRHWPAMVALIVGADGRPLALHRTWLAELNLACEARPRIDKAPVERPKMALGGLAGGAVRLWRGASQKPWAAMPAAETLVVGEGLEDTLTAICLWPQWRAISAVSLGNMLSLELPNAISEIRLLAQNDGADTPAGRLAARVISRWLGEGRRVKSWRPPVFVKDLNAMAQRRMASQREG